MNEFCVVFWTCKDLNEAKEICKSLLQKKWIACASFLPNVISMFYWDEGIQTEEEVKVFIKTTSKRYSEVQAFIQHHSSYEVSEILQIPIESGNPSYLKWVKEITV
ncbi:MAG: hypothetical protein COT84_01925 [Chlamydiae bacterium CG10_big_fil_rev_8_21_14_0_10_35_9]|nr:MAG: hypothetical protein COT84_01925 [Chlamydiae bacterium CG10_big_fil_rev_8_21_14_0_10_35_9]